MKSGIVIPDKPRSGAGPESIVEHSALRWIPGLRFAAPGMTSRFLSDFAKL
jgi:hypothetical protein